MYTSNSTYSGDSFSIEGNYLKTDTDYFTSDSGTFFIGASCNKRYRKGLWRKTHSGAKYVSALRPHSEKKDTFIFDVLRKDSSKDYYLLILKEDRFRIVSAGGFHATF